MVKKLEYSLWTSKRDPAALDSLFGKVSIEQLRALEKAILEADREKIEKERKAEQEACRHARVMPYIHINTRGFYWESRHYSCMDCGLETNDAIGIYKAQEKV